MQCSGQFLCCFGMTDKGLTRMTSDAYFYIHELSHFFSQHAVKQIHEKCDASKSFNGAEP